MQPVIAPHLACRFHLPSPSWLPVLLCFPEAVFSLREHCALDHSRTPAGLEASLRGQREKDVNSDLTLNQLLMD